MVGGMSQALLALANAIKPQEFKTVISAVLANVVGQLPDDYWKEMMISLPCTSPGCDCHVVAGHTMDALTLLRNDHIKTLSARSVKN